MIIAMAADHGGYELKNAIRDHLTAKGYTFVLRNNALIMGYANTFFYVISGTILSVIFCSLGGYCVSRRGTLWMRYLTLMMTFCAQGTEPVDFINNPYVASEVVKTIVGSFGLVLVAPLTAFCGGFILRRYPDREEGKT